MPENLWVWILIGAALLGMIIFMNVRGKKKQAEHAEQVKERLVVGVRIMTVGGVVGTIVSIDDKEDTMTILVAPDDVKLTFIKGALHSIFGEKKVDPVISYDEEAAADEKAENSAETKGEKVERMERELKEKAEKLAQGFKDSDGEIVNYGD